MQGIASRRTITQQETPSAESVLAANSTTPALGNQDLLDLTLPQQSPFDDEAEVAPRPWLAGDEFQTADFLVGLREQGPGIAAADALVQSFGPTW